MCAACVSVYVYAVLSSCFIQKRGEDRSTRLGKVFAIFVDMPRRERKATIQRDTERKDKREERRYFLEEPYIVDLNKK